ncbi:MAG: PD-(D/E)XK nuclease family protein [Clostridia bacterium]|nr:PD-(D/E)XK nuclease family protein [Clostridia bacterium]
MLSLITGRASSGKSFEILNRIEKAVSLGVHPILLVPEQSSFQSERAVLKRLGDALAQRVSVLSFTRLCDEVERITGGICAKTLTEADKLILMNRAVRISRDDLTLWNGYAKSMSFAKGMLAQIEEFKQSAISAEQLLDAAKKCEGTALSFKLLDTSIIFRNYNMFVAERFIDPSDRLDKLYLRLKENDYFKDATVFIDSFEGFTGQQFKILERIIASAANVTIAITDDPSDTREYSLLKNIKKTKRKILNYASLHSVKIGDETHLANSRYGSSDMRLLENLIFSGEIRESIESKNIIVCKAQTVYDEAEFVARNIRKLVREENARFSDFVVIARDTAPYESPLKFACEKNDVSCFIDKRQPLSSLPAANAVLSAIDASRKFSTEKILRFLKSGIGILSTEEISKIENYTHIWDIDGSLWEENWEMNPCGFKTGINDKEKEQLKEINELRDRVMRILKDFKMKFCGSVEDMAVAIVKLLENCNAANSFAKLAKAYEEKGEQIYAEALRKSWDTLMSLLDSMVSCFSSSLVSKDEFCESLKNAIAFTDVGIIPQNVDEVTFGAADRIRPSRPKYAFIMGANQGIFPKNAPLSSIFGTSERSKLIELDIDIRDITEDNAIDEEFLVYSNLCCPSDKLFVSTTMFLNDGTKSEPSAFIEVIQKNLNCATVYEPSKLTYQNIPETVQSCFSEFCRRSYPENIDSRTLREALKNEDMEERLEAVSSGISAVKASLSEETARNLFGTTLKMSPTAFESYNGCPFKYFCKYGLRAQNIIPAKFNPAQTGTVVHYVLERIVDQYGKKIADFSEDKIRQETDSLVEEYLNSIDGYKAIETLEMKYQVLLIKRTLRYVVQRLCSEFAQTEFEPVCCELKFSDNDGDIPAIRIQLDDAQVVLNGVVDRVDRWNDYIRIVDYKTGERKFKLPDILYGQNMQMILYLYALKNSSDFSGKAGGIFYMKAKHQKHSKPADRRMNGILPSKKELATAMEKGNKGEFIPKFNEKNPSESYIEEEDFEKIFNFVNGKIKSTAKNIFSGCIDAEPIDGLDGKACEYCDFATVCRVEDRNRIRVPSLKKEEVISEIERSCN